MKKKISQKNIDLTNAFLLVLEDENRSVDDLFEIAQYLKDSAEATLKYRLSKQHVPTGFCRQHSLNVIL